MGFYETSGTVNMIGYRTALTAAHVLYDTLITNAWICQDGSTSNSGCPGTGYPRMRFNVEDGGGFSNWINWGCWTATMPTAFINESNSSSMHEFARWDYAVIDLSHCTTAGMGHYGTDIASDQELLDMTGYLYGYPARARCGDNDSGTWSDCPGTGSFPGSTYRYNGDTTIPFSGAEIWGWGNTIVEPGDSNSSHTVDCAVDATQGQSGGALYYIDGGTRRVVGTLTGSDKPENRNVFHRWNWETRNFVEANSDFPDDF